MDESTPAYLQAKLGQTPDGYHLQSAEDYRDLAAQMLTQASRSLKLITPDLEPQIFDQTPFITAFKQLALNSRVAQIHILVQDNSLVRQQGHRLIELAQRLPSSIEIRKPGKAYREFAESFLLVDDSGYLHRKLADRYQATASFNHRLQVSQLESVFTAAWEAGEPDIELMRLHI